MANGASIRLAIPRWLSASASTSGTRSDTAARPTGPATYPPPPSTASACSARSTRAAAPVAFAASAAAPAAATGFDRDSPRTRIGRSS